VAPNSPKELTSCWKSACSRHWWLFEDPEDVGTPGAADWNELTSCWKGACSRSDCSAKSLSAFHGGAPAPAPGHWWTEASEVAGHWWTSMGASWTLGGGS